MSKRAKKLVFTASLLVLVGIMTSGGGCGSGGCDEDEEYESFPEITFTVSPESVTRLASGADELRRFHLDIEITSTFNAVSPRATTILFTQDPEGIISDYWTSHSDPPEDTEFTYPNIVATLPEPFDVSYQVEYDCIAVGTTTITVEWTLDSPDEDVTDHTNTDTVEVTCELYSPPDGGPDASTDEGCDDDVEGETAAALAVALKLGITEEEFCNSALLRVVINQILHSSNSVPSKPTNDDQTETQAIAPVSAPVSGSKALELFGAEIDGKDMTDFPCGDGPNGYTICPPSAGTFPSGDAIIVFNVLVDDMPLDDSTNTYQYGFVFDEDGVTGNNYMASVSYPNDFFDNTDTWYVAEYSPSGGWSLAATDATGGGMVTFTTDARIIIAGNAMILVVPASEFTVEFPMFRVTDFRHTGDWGINAPHDWDGCVYPAVADGLHDWS